MAASAHRGIGRALLVLAALGASQAGAQMQVYRCGARTYSQAPCPGGRLVGVTPHRVTDRSKPPPQDRAIAAKRAVLAPEQRQECRALDVRLREEQRSLRARGDAVTIEDEMPLVRAQKRFRELRC
ncbi:hypothetical protein [Ramlibacter alkalitolerans]|jgi:hypothetical protein|uniref:DUF4124 domain-containing protein n=1 Tax=Ramlibacter alkalitolerans TaxID=2039631 RepID=A0ABS1JJ91_9BURK|nr:hypothetical protein [Ramlibacter alkalitolerans]MBL0424303.1 hypothetical protein [Ramlibacter alkalitolerans]